MPRLTHQQYLHQRKRLQVDWFERRGFAFIELESQEQMDLHDFFGPTEAFTDEQALEHRIAMTEAFPSLPQKAGRAYKNALPFLDGPTPQPAPVVQLGGNAKREHTKGPRRVVVRGLRQPHVNVQKLARAIYRMAEDDAKKQAEEERDKAA